MAAPPILSVLMLCKICDIASFANQPTVNKWFRGSNPFISVHWLQLFSTLAVLKIFAGPKHGAL